MNTIFSCKRCGFCCHGESTVSLDKGDQKNMLKVLKISRDEASKKYWRISDKEIQMKTVDGHCIFYQEGCTVHRGRPWRCREWPLVRAILIDKDNFETIRSSCPGIAKTASYQDICSLIKEGGCLEGL